jgi:hypothetical protein
LKLLFNDGCGKVTAVENNFSGVVGLNEPPLKSIYKVDSIQTELPLQTCLNF